MTSFTGNHGAIFSVDAGFAQTKWYTGSSQGKFASAIAKPDTIVTAGLGAETKKYTIGGETLVVGKAALTAGAIQDYDREISWLIDRVPFFVAHAATEAGIDFATIDTLALGLPISDFRKHRASLIERMTGFTVNGTQYSPRIQVYAQGVGALFAYAREGSSVRQDDQGLLLDCGGNTAICVQHDGYQVSAEGTRQYSKMGISVAAEKLCARLRETMGIEYSLPEAMEIMRTREVKNRGKRINVSKEVDEAITPHIQGLIKTISNDYSARLIKMDHLLLAGGGASLIKQNLPSDLCEMAIVLEDSEFANVRGFFRYAVGG
jgi:plasmid segregation protein ParM